MRAFVESAVAGVLAGVAATLAMSAVLLAGRRVGLYSAHPPEMVVKRATDPHGPAPTLQPDEQDDVWPIVHVDLGAMFGLVYGVARRIVPRSLRNPAGGVLLGLGLWLVNYGVLAPALRLAPPVPHGDAGRQLTNALGHAVYGAALVGLLERGRSGHR